MSRHPLRTLEALVLVGVGGFAGANLRYAVSLTLRARRAPVRVALGDAAALVAPGLPGTLAVNVLGSFALGLLVYEAANRDLLTAEFRILLGTGFLSSLTTYSTFAVQTAGVSPAMMVGNVAANYLLGFAGVVAGRWVAVTYGGDQ